VNGLRNLHRRLVADGPCGLPERVLYAFLVALSWVFALLSWVRRTLYRFGLLSVYRASVPVVSVGNLTAGGTGKTPMVDYVVKLLLARNRRVAVVSRGYGGSGFGPVGVVCAGDGPLLPPRVCGDEPYLLARRNPTAVVLVAPRRADGIRVAVERFGADVVVLDDGFQHLAVARDLDIVLLDARRPFGNRHLLPAGLLREPPTALRRAGLVALTRSDGCEGAGLRLDVPLVRCRHRLADEAVALDGAHIPLATLAGRRLVAFAGIADPEGFFSALVARGVHPLRTLPLSDHVVYDRELLEALCDAAATADFLVTTEKDGVKLAADQLPVICCQIPMTLEFYDEGSLLLQRALGAVIPQEMP